MVFLFSFWNRQPAAVEDVHKQTLNVRLCISIHDIAQYLQLDATQLILFSPVPKKARR